jgi:hypothetical protein
VKEILVTFYGTLWIAGAMCRPCIAGATYMYRSCIAGAMCHGSPQGGGTVGTWRITEQNNSRKPYTRVSNEISKRLSLAWRSGIG